MKRILPLWLRTPRVIAGLIVLYIVLSAVCLIALHEQAHATLRQSSEGTAIAWKLPPQMSFVRTQSPVAKWSFVPPRPSKKPKNAEEDTQNRIWKFDRDSAEAMLLGMGIAAIHQPITAFVEGPYPPPGAVISMGDRGDMAVGKDRGTPPVYKKPLPLRTQTPDDLHKVTYPRVQTCHDMPHKFPVDRGLQFDAEDNPILWNVGDDPSPPNLPEIELPYCPVEADPFLPWIHDLFPSSDGAEMHIMAQNKRRCRTGKKFDEDVYRLLPQVALMQPVSVRRITQNEAQKLAPTLWNDAEDTPRYQLVPLDEASPDSGRYTRFICLFHSLDFATGKRVIVNETLSAYPFNYELAALRKGNTILHTPKGKDGKFFWTSNLHFTCPIPESLQNLIRTGTTVLSNGSPTIWLDIIPLRTPARYNRLHLGPELIGPVEKLDHVTPWNVTEDFGNSHVFPTVRASGRWSNLPICAPYAPSDIRNAATQELDEKADKTEAKRKKPHYLSACLWASAEFKTRGQKKGSLSDTSQRLYEWLTFHFMVGFDHVYVYDNSAGNSNTTNLEPVLRQFGDRVSRIEWPSIVCNNNIPAADSTGERSSQYAAENSCRSRYAPFTEWIASFDTDEYFVPMGVYNSLPEFLRDMDKAGTNILTFRSSRGRLRQEASIHDGNGRARLSNVTFLEAYNCDSAGSPKPAWADRARKQIYRADYVAYHFVHYSTVTQGHMQRYDRGYTVSRYVEKPPSERVVDEMNEAVLVHAKTIKKDMTSMYEKRCRNDYEKKWQGCWVAYPWPNDKEEKPNEDANGMEYNCFINRKVDEYWVPKLRKALQSLSFSS